MAQNLSAADIGNHLALTQHIRLTTWSEYQTLMRLVDVAVQALLELGADKLALDLAERKSASLNRVHDSMCAPPREEQN